MMGMEIDRPHPTGPIKLTQRFFIEYLVKTYGLPERRKRAVIPLSPSCDVQFGPLNPDPRIPYKVFVESLSFLSRCTRPDIAFAVNFLLRYKH